MVLLFPVISASDDLHAMRAQMEEPAFGKHSVGQAAEEKTPAWRSRSQNLSPVGAFKASFGLTSEAWQDFWAVSVWLPAAPSILRAGRAPPVSRLW
jgi:hypothetical protein